MNTGCEFRTSSPLFFTVSETLMTSDIGVIKFTVLSDGHLITKCYVFFRFSKWK